MSFKKTSIHLIFRICCVALCELIILTSALPANAKKINVPDNATLDMYGQNGIFYYNPVGTAQCVMGVGSYSGEASAGLSPTQAGFVDQYHDIAAQLSVEYGIPWEAVIAQGILESAAGTSKFAVNRNNFFGIGAFDSNPNNAYSYATPEEGWRGYFENIRKTSTYRNHGVFQGDTITDPYAYIVAIKNAGYATDTNYISKNHNIIDAVLNRAQEKGWKTSAELAVEFPEMLTNAAQYAAGTSDSPTSNQSYTGDACIPTNASGGAGAGSGDINQTALDLAWPSKGHGKNDPSAAYKQAAISLWGEEAWSSHYNGASCDLFVATVMRYSGIDPNFPLVHVGNPGDSSSSSIAGYLHNNPDYIYVGTGDGSVQAQPGDIRIKYGSHVEMVVQKSDGSLGIASASLNDRTGEVTGYYPSSQYHIYRHK